MWSNYAIICLYLLNLQIHFSSTTKWSPSLVNQSKINEPFDYIDEKYLPNLTNEPFDWGSISGVMSKDSSASNVGFGGTQINGDTNKPFDYVYRKKSGIIVFCTNLKSGNSEMDIFKLNLKCQSLKKTDIKTSENRYIGVTVKLANLQNDVAIMFCDPLWSIHEIPEGICYLYSRSSDKVNFLKNFSVCIERQQCMAGFSLDLESSSYEINALLGLPYGNKSIEYKKVKSSGTTAAKEITGNNFNFGYSVAYSSPSTKYISSPNPGVESPFVEIHNGFKFYMNETEVYDQFGGFGTSLDTLKLSTQLTGAIIGAPYQSKLNLPNLGAIFLACQNFPIDVVYGDAVNSYFGYTVSRLGDINFDGTDDFAVSSPNIFEGANSNGKLYIFTTTKDCKINKKPVQMYESSAKGFGIGISRAFDLDFNKSPDFFVTSLQSKKPYLFSMPAIMEVYCNLKSKDLILLKQGEEHELKVDLQKKDQIDLSVYNYQIKLDTLYKKNITDIDERFELVKLSFHQSYLTILIKANFDVAEMDLISIPLQFEIRGVRPCKQNPSGCGIQENSSKFRLPEIKWTSCDKLRLKLKVCERSQCESDLKLSIEANGTLLKYGDIENARRSLEVTLIDSVAQKLLFLTVQTDNVLNNELVIDKVEFQGDHKLLQNRDGQFIKLIIKNNDEKINKVRIYLLYRLSQNRSVEISQKPGIKFSTWGVYEDVNWSNNNKTIYYNVIFEPKLTFSLQATQRDLTIDTRSKPQYLYKGMRVQVHEMGTNLKFNFIVENRGPALSKVKFRLSFPYRTTLPVKSDDNQGLQYQLLLYLMDKVRQAADNKWLDTTPGITRLNKPVGKCVFDPSDMINPLKLLAVETHDHDDKVDKTGSNNTTSGGRRVKRSVTAPGSETNGKSSNNDKNPESNEDNTVPIKCDTKSKTIGTPICANIICTLDEVPKNSVFNFNFRAWLFTKTFFDNKLSDVKITVSLESDLGILPPGIQVLNDQKGVGPVDLVQQVLFKNMKVVEKRKLPLWILILAIIIGILILAIIIIIAYYCGFFKRKRLQKTPVPSKSHPNSPVPENQPLNA